MPPIPSSKQYSVSAQALPSIRTNMRFFLPVFIAAAIFLFLFSSRIVNIYDESIMLTGAMQVLAGRIQHRDFYFLYGPFTLYLLAGLFKVFGQSILVSRLAALAIQGLIASSTYCIVATYCRRYIAILTTLACLGWMYGGDIALQGAGAPAILATLWIGALMVAVFRSQVSLPRMLAAGALSGFLVWCRYDVGIAVIGTCLMLFAVAHFLPGLAPPKRIQVTFKIACAYLLGAASVIVPVIVACVPASPLHDFLFDLYIFPSKNYYAARHIPFPGVTAKNLESIGFYLPALLIVLCLYAVLLYYRGLSIKMEKDAPPLERTWIAVLITFTLFMTILFLKGLVRPDMHLAPAVVLSAPVIAILVEHRFSFGRWVRFLIIALLMVLCVSAFWATLHMVHAVWHKRSMMAMWMIRPSSQGPLPPQQYWCKMRNPMTKGLCFFQDDDHLQTIEFITAKTRPTDYLYVGVPHHDRIFATDLLTYFAAQRLPATKWSEFDPLLENTLPIQQEMVAELEKTKPPYIVLDSEYDQIIEPNDSRKSSGVHLLDNYVAGHYQVVKIFGVMTVLQRTPISAGS